MPNKHKQKLKHAFNQASELTITYTCKSWHFSRHIRMQMQHHYTRQFISGILKVS